MLTASRELDYAGSGGGGRHRRPAAAQVRGASARRVRRRGVDLPVHIGVPGALDAARLVRISSRIGVEASARFARHHATWLPHLLRIGGYHPGLLVEGLAPSLADPNDRVAGFHFYTFNELARTERWRQQTLARLSASA